MGMVSLADKALAETFESADYVIVVRKRADGKTISTAPPRRRSQKWWAKLCRCRASKQT